MRSNLHPCLCLSGYIYRIAKNHTLNLIRNNNFRVSRDMEYFNDMEKTVEMPAGEGSGTDTYTMLNNAIEKLSPQRMAICRMKISEGLSNQEIADRLGISVNTVKNQYSTSIRQLRALMGVGMAVAVVINTLPMI